MVLHIISIGTIFTENIMNRSKVCEQCGEKLNANGKENQKRFCSISCSAKFTRNRPRTGEFVVCETCGKEIYQQKHQNIRFCSRGCYYAFRWKNKVRVKRYCDNCNKAFYVKKSKDTARFCSQKCKFASQKGVNHPSYKGGRVIRSFPAKSGHISKYWIVRDERISNNHCERLEHRVIVEKAIKRQLKRTEIVHHINCDTLDNRNENLLLCSGSYHAFLHNKMSHLYGQKFL